MHASNLWPLRLPQPPWLIRVVAHSTTLIAQGQICAYLSREPLIIEGGKLPEGGGRGGPPYKQEVGVTQDCLGLSKLVAWLQSELWKYWM